MLNRLPSSNYDSQSSRNSRTYLEKTTGVSPNILGSQPLDRDPIISVRYLQQDRYILSEI